MLLAEFGDWHFAHPVRNGTKAGGRGVSFFLHANACSPSLLLVKVNQLHSLQLLQNGKQKSPRFFHGS
jgi:hypothetical protein